MRLQGPRLGKRYKTRDSAKPPFGMSRVMRPGDSAGVTRPKMLGINSSKQYLGEKKSFAEVNCRCQIDYLLAEKLYAYGFEMYDFIHNPTCFMVKQSEKTMKSTYGWLFPIGRSH